jgi:hypothetical protein
VAEPQASSVFLTASLVSVQQTSSDNSLCAAYSLIERAYCAKLQAVERRLIEKPECVEKLGFGVCFERSSHFLEVIIRNC